MKRGVMELVGIIGFICLVISAYLWYDRGNQEFKGVKTKLELITAEKEEMQTTVSECEAKVVAAVESNDELRTALREHGGRLDEVKATCAETQKIVEAQKLVIAELRVHLKLIEEKCAVLRKRQSLLKQRQDQSPQRYEIELNTTPKAPVKQKPIAEPLPIKRGPPQGMSGRIKKGESLVEVLANQIKELA